MRVTHPRTSLKRNALAAAIALLAGSSLPATPARAAPDLTGLTLADLMNLHVSVTAAAKRPQPLSDVAAAVFVLTGDDIRRSGATSIPDALRLVPGLQVARINNGAWAITARGFNSAVSNKLLVLIDGRSIYNPMFGGVLWDQQDVMLDDIERIEVIRGPGATLWGANAVNGVIDIITKPATSTEGALVTAGAGTVEQGFGSARFGGALGATGAYRVWATFDDWKSSSAGNEGGTVDEPYTARSIGFRTDLGVSALDRLMVSGQAIDNSYGETTTLPSLLAPYSRTARFQSDDVAGNLLARWSHTTSGDADYSLQGFYSHESAERAVASAYWNVFDLQFEDRAPVSQGQNLVWGVGYRANLTHLRATPYVQGTPADNNDNIANAFVQDEIVLADTVKFTAGTKLEHNDYTGFEVEPGARLIWTPNPASSLWAAVSRAVRTPSAGEEFTRIVQSVMPNPQGPFAPPFEISGEASGLGAEHVLTYELGYRLRPAENLSFDLATYYSDYGALRAGGPATLRFVPAPVPHLVYAVTTVNGGSVKDYGAELAVEWQPVEGWRLRANYSLINGQGRLSRNATNDSADLQLGAPPHNQFQIQSSMDLPHNVEADLVVRYVGKLEPQIGAYATADARLGWRPVDWFEASLVGQNLFGNAHAEFLSESDYLPTDGVKVDRRGYVKATFRF